MVPSGFSWKHIERVVRGSTYKPLLIAHRGASGTAPENTLVSFQKAIAEGADAIECDVRLTQDGEVVVIHDATLRRTTNGKGYVSEYELRELRKLDAGSWFHHSFSRERLPTLREVFELVNAGVGLNIEIKPVPAKKMAEQIVQKCLRMIRTFKAHDHVLLTSFQHSLLRLINQEDPSALVGLLYHPLHHFGKSPVRLAQRYDARVAIHAVRFLRKKLVADARHHGIAVAAYAVDTEKNLDRCLLLGIEGIVTNVPAKILKLLKKKL